MKTAFKVLTRGAIAAIAAIALLIGGDFVAPQAAMAYPFWAQQVAPATPREATGRIVCANCHLAKKETLVEVPQSVLPDTVFEAVVKIPYDTSVQQVTGTGEPGPLNVGAVLMLPEGFKIAPEDRIPEELKEKTEGLFYQSYAEGQDNVVIVGPLPGDQYQEIVFPVLSPNPAEDKAIKFGKYAVHVGGNRGRGQVYPTGDKSNNTVFNASAAGTIGAIGKTDDGGYLVTIIKEDGSTAEDAIPAGPQPIVKEGDVVAAGQAITNDPNVGGFGQTDTEIVLQDPNRVLGLLALFVAVMITQILLVLKKKQVEKVQAAEMNF
ncbi:cytochrome f [Limnothrix redekei]|uniref:Cytochrome f n=1 Tax=Limnothrix redekei LRLZ20PSL1 TaxID=3112953 RepID=A0ABW7CI91_9CYAN